MAFGDPIQWLVIGVVVVLLLLWGPSKIPELAKGIGRARRELAQAQKESERSPEAVQRVQGQQPQTTAQQSADDTLLQTARQLGIVTEGKTKEEIAAEIVALAGPRS